MWKSCILAVGLVVGVPGHSQDAAAAPAPQVLPGEGLAVADPDRTVHLYGEVKQEAPMGSLAKLVWLRLEGGDWAAQSPSYTCTGQMGAYKCWLPTGHGRVDLAKATRESCNLAYLAWAKASAERWKRLYGEGAARARLEDAFRPFLGNRLPYGEKLPEMTPDWVGDGDLLRTSPEAMLEWLMDPTQEEMLEQAKRLIIGFLMVEFTPDAWWMKTGTASVPSDPAATSAWVVGSSKRTIAVLHVPRGSGKVEGMARFKELMGIKKK
jgi:hypothetical protein